MILFLLHLHFRGARACPESAFLNDWKVTSYHCLNLDCCRDKDRYLSPTGDRSVPKIYTSWEMLSHVNVSHPPRWDNIFAPSSRAKYIMTSWRCQEDDGTKGSGVMALCFVQLKQRYNWAFYYKLKALEKNNQSPHCGRDKGIHSSCPWYAISTTRQASSWIANHGHSDGIPLSLP